jgi:hypothetical protein
LADFSAELGDFSGQIHGLLTSEQREKVLIIDDSTYDRSRSKVVELLAWVHDHNANRSLKGFKLMTLGWSDGASFLPLDFTCSAPRPRRASDSRGPRRRWISLLRLQTQTGGYAKSTEHLETMVKRVLTRGIRADSLLMDSWFALPSLLVTLGKHLPVICMGKDMPKVFYRHNGQWFILGRLFAQLKKRPDKAKILASVMVTTKKDQQIKINQDRSGRRGNRPHLLETMGYRGVLQDVEALSQP